LADFEVYFINVGEGDATLLKMPGDQWALIDVFRCEGHGIDLFKALDDRLPTGQGGKPRLDYLIITHAHDDHIRGLADLIDRYDVREVWGPRYETSESLGERFEEFRQVMQEHPNVVVQKGSRSPIAQLGSDGTVTVRCFSPPGYIDINEALTEQQQREQVHEFCGVLKFDYAGVSVMFAGDSDLRCWKRIIGYYENVADENDITVVASTVLHASHHGSYSFFKDVRDGDAWLDGLNVIAPEAVVVSVGPENRYGHPDADTMTIYGDRVGSNALFETQEQGTLILAVESDGAFTLQPDDGKFAELYGWEDDDGSDGRGRDDDGGQPILTPPSPPRRRRPKPDPDEGRTYG
jgi:competence protein ComEC